MGQAQRTAREIVAAIAAEVGVTTRTVYRVLNEREGEVWSSAAERGERIRALARKLGYRPNLAARSTRTGRFAQVAFILGMGDSVSTFSHVFLKGLHDGLAAAEVALVAARLPDEMLGSAERLPAILRNLSVDGLMILYNKPETAQMQQALRDCRLPVVWLNDRRDHDCVHYDDAQGAAEAVARLHALGHRRIAYSCGYARGHHHSLADRLDGYRRAMVARGLPVEVAPAPDERVPLHQHLEAWLRAAEPPDAVVCYGQEEATALLLAAARAGIAVPGRLAIAHCAQDEARPMGVALSRVYCEAYRCAWAGADLMLRKLAQPRRRLPAVALPYAWWDHGVTAAARA